MEPEYAAIRRYYDQPDLDEDLDRRRADTGHIDIWQHLSPEDLGKMIRREIYEETDIPHMSTKGEKLQESYGDGGI